MAENTGKKKAKRKAWVYSKEAKIPRTTVWRSNKVDKKNAGSSTPSESIITTLLDVEATDRSAPLCSPRSLVSKSACLNDLEISDQIYPGPSTSPTNSDDQSIEDSTNFEDGRDESLSFLLDTGGDSVDIVEDSTNPEDSISSIDEFLPFLVDTCSDLVDSGQEDESDTEPSDSSSDSEFDDSEQEEEIKRDNDEISDDDVPLYNGASVSKLGALILVMLFSLRHQLSGQALVDLVKVLRALLPDGHKFVSSAYSLKKYFSELFGEPLPRKHSYCGNCLGRIRKGEASCSKEKCRNSKKKIEHFLELNLHLRLCQLYRGKEN